MAKWVNDDVLDAMLDEICLADEIHICSSQPTTYAEAEVTYQLASGTLVPGDGNGDFTIANGDASGRKATVSQQADLTVDNTGDAQHVALCIGGGTDKLLLVTTCTLQGLTAGNTVTVPAFDDEVADPS